MLFVTPISLMKYASWEITSTVPRYFLMVWASIDKLETSRLFVGSSNMKISGTWLEIIRQDQVLILRKKMYTKT